MRYTLNVTTRILLLTANVFLLSWIAWDSRLFFNQVILALILVGQVVLLIHFVNRTNRKLVRFLEAIRHHDHTLTFAQPPLSKSFRDLQQSMGEIMNILKQVDIEKEGQYHFLQQLVNQLQVGVISLSGDELKLINPTAEELLNVTGTKDWQVIRQANPSFTSALAQMGNQNRRLVEVVHHEEKKTLAVDVSTLMLLETRHTLITLQDINAEIEQKEIEAWHKLIRILTHEIMNSITPISSLTETVQGLLAKHKGDPTKPPSFPQETLSDIRFALDTIQHRSEGLMTFLDHYRKLTRVPTPQMKPVNVHDFLFGVGKLMSEGLLREGITLSVTCGDKDLVTPMDRAMMEQVLINLITNSAHALANQGEKRIQLNGYTTEYQIVIEVSDNGEGIPAHVLKEIFIPFFSTKKEGSGIGLSLSKQIVGLHGGKIQVKSTPEKGTTVLIRLRLPTKD